MDSSDARRKARKQRVQKLIKYLAFSGSGLGLFLTVASLMAGNWQVALAWAMLTIAFMIVAIAYKFVSGVINRVLDKIEEESEKPEEWLADRIVGTVDNFVLGFWWKLTSPFKRKYYKSLIYAYRDYRTQGLKTKGPFTLDLEKVFVPLRVAPESAEQISPAMIQSSARDSIQSIWDFLAASKGKSAYRSMVIIAPPGSGKTTVLEHLTLTYAQNTQRQQHRKVPQLIPILLYLRDVRSAMVHNQYSLSELIEQLPSIHQLNPPPQWFERKLHRSSCLVMLDGLDEVVGIWERQSVSHWLNQQIKNYPHARFILTSRPFGYKDAPVQSVKTILEVQPFNLEQMQKFIHNWYLQHEIMSRLGKDDPGVRQLAETKSNDLIERIKNSPPLAVMAVNPLLLTMIATVHCYRGALPGIRVELYAEICDVLLGRRREEKGIVEPLTAEQKKAVLQVLALGLMSQNTREFTPDIGSSLISSELAKVAGSGADAQAFLVNIETVSGLLVEREKGIYEFAYRNFQEYLAAVQIKESNQEQLLISNINHSWWDETIRLYAAISDASNLIRAALDNPTVVSLKLALDCREEGLRIEPEVSQQLSDKLEAGLESNDPEIFKLAASVKLAWRLNKLLRVDENIQIDQSYITHAEYQLFVDEQLNSPSRFPSGSAKRPITGISYQNAIRFCNWLNGNGSSFISNNGDAENLYCYRLPTVQESQEIAATQAYKQLECWTIGESNNSNPKRKGIRVIRAKIPTAYTKLANYLAAGEWKQAYEETELIKLKITNRENQGYLDVGSINQFPDQERRTIDQLWLYYSNGYFGSSIKERMDTFKKIWNSGKSVLNQKNMEVFRTNADEITQLLCESLGFKTLNNSDTFEQLYGQMIDASNPAFQLNIRPNFPLIYACKTAFSEEDAWKIGGLLNKFGINADFFALLFVFDNHQQIRQQLRESPYKNDFIVLNQDQLLNILAANSPIQKLTNCILEQIDLVAVSPYTVSGPVQKKMFFGRAKEEKTLLQNISRNDYALIANRKTGKTSLLNRIYIRLKNIQKHQVFYCDLQTVTNYDIFYQTLALSYPEFEEEIGNFSELSPLSFRKLISSIKQRNSNRQIIFIFDEVDEILAYEIKEKEQLFKTFRSLSQRENIRFIFSGTTTLVKRVRHPESPLFNFCNPIKIGILDEKAAQELVRVPMATLGVKFENEAAIVQRILDLAAQHPNIIQYICDALIKRINEKQKRTIEEQDLDMVVTSQEFYEYFESLIWGQSTALEKLIVYAMWYYPEFTESEVIEEFKWRRIPSDGVKASLEILLTYSTLSKKNDKYFFTFRKFAKLMEERNDIQALTEQYQQEVGVSEA